MNRNRRGFLANVGQGMLVPSIGSGLATELGLTPAVAADGPERLLFRDREPVVGPMQDTPAKKLLPILLEKPKAGTKLDDLVAAGALANTRTTGGLNDEGRHCFAALLPSLQMSRERPRPAAPYRCSRCSTATPTACRVPAAASARDFVPSTSAELPNGRSAGDVLRDTFRRGDAGAAERTFAALAQGKIGDAYNNLQYCVYDEIDVHRVLLSWRAWVVIDLVLGGYHSTWRTVHLLEQASTPPATTS